MIALDLRAVGKTFNQGTDQEVEAVRDVDLRIERGEFVSVIGPSGCGKSTLLRLIGDLTPPSAGRLAVNGKSPEQARLDRDYGMVFQTSTLLEWRKVQANVELPLEVMGMGKAERSDRSAAMLDLVQLDRFGDHYPWQLSGGCSSGFRSPGLWPSSRPSC